jgi:hypothetical protein
MSDDSPGKGRKPAAAEPAASMLEQRLFGRALATRERRHREEGWLASLMSRRVVRFSDVQIAAELLARHRWEDASRAEQAGASGCLDALRRLCALRARREGWSTLPSPLPPGDGAA